MLHCPLEPLSLSHSSIQAQMLAKLTLKTSQRGVLPTRYETWPIIKTRVQIQTLQVVPGVILHNISSPPCLYLEGCIYKIRPCILGRTFSISISISYRNKDTNKGKNKHCVSSYLLLSQKPQLLL